MKNTVLPMDDLTFIKDVIHRMNTQDNRGTAAPYFYQIETYERALAHEGEGETVWIDSAGEGEMSTDEEINAYLMENDQDNYQKTLEWYDIETLDYNEYDELLKDLDYTKYNFTREPVLKGFFLTEDAAKNHLKSNHYHYSHDARTYVSYAFRSSEFLGFIESVARLVDMEYAPMGSAKAVNNE